MTKDNVNQLTPIVNDGEILFSSEQVGTHLGYADPAKAISNLFHRNQTELEAYSTILSLRNVHGKQYQVRHFTEEGVYIISMLANTEKAASFRAYFAKVLREVRSQQMQLAHESGYAQGLDYAQSLPAVQAHYQKGFLAGHKEASDPRKDRLAKVRKAHGYLQKGLTLAEAALLVNMSHQCLGDNLHKLGLRKKVRQHAKKAV